MTRTYKATLRGDRLEWAGNAPDESHSEQEVEVIVTIPQNADTSSRAASDGKAMAEALNRLASSGSLSNISDPLAWQDEQRKERGRRPTTA
jgi:hypothetical protein